MTTPWDPPPPPGPPPPPPGPGVQTPFAVPPTERDPRRLWLTLGIGAALLVLCCGGGALGIGGLVVAQTRALRPEATTVVRHYLDGLEAHDYHQSYDLLCADVRRAMSYAEFASAQDRAPQVASYVLADPRLAGQEVIVDATVTAEGGNLYHRSFGLAADSDSGQLRICRGE